MPSTTLQSRISAFEALGVAPTTSSLSSPPPRSISKSPSPSPPNLGRKTSLIDLKDWVVDDGPPNGSTPRMNGHSTQRVFDTKPQHISTPLINLESPPKPKQNRTIKPPPLPPRKPSYTGASSSNALIPPQRSDSLSVDSAHTYPPLKSDSSSRAISPRHAPASSISSFHSVSLSSDTDPSTPGSVSNFIATFPMDHYDRDFSVSSEPDSISLAESYEEVSTPSMASPATERIITLDWEKAMAKRKAAPPKLPRRPSTSSSISSVRPYIKSPPPRPPPLPAPGTRSTPSSPKMRATISAASSSSTIASNFPTTTRRIAPPPPPSRSSDRSSILSTSSSTNSYQHLHTPRSLSSLTTKARRPTPIPSAARMRYETVFNANVVQRRKAEKQKANERPALLSPAEAKRTRQAAGWRGLSVDLITGAEGVPVARKDGDESEDDINGVVGDTERLDGCIVKFIWNRCGLDKRKLFDIWNECDMQHQGSLDREAFVKGMWRIDEELRRAQAHAIKSASSPSLGAFRSRQTSGSSVKGGHKTKVILR